MVNTSDPVHLFAINLVLYTINEGLTEHSEHTITHDQVGFINVTWSVLFAIIGYSDLHTASPYTRIHTWEPIARELLLWTVTLALGMPPLGLFQRSPNLSKNAIESCYLVPLVVRQSSNAIENNHARNVLRKRGKICAFTPPNHRKRNL